MRKNVIYERARFNIRNQQDGESAEQVHRLVENCDYGTLTDELIRNRLVVGIQNSQLSKSLQLDPDIILEKAKKNILQHEAVQEQAQELKGVSTNSLEEIKLARGQFRLGRGRFKGAET